MASKSPLDNWFCVPREIAIREEEDTRFHPASPQPRCPIPSLSSFSASPRRRPPHSPGPSLPEGERGERPKKSFFLFPPLPRGEILMPPQRNEKFVGAGLVPALLVIRSALHPPGRGQAPPLRPASYFQ